MSPRDPITYQGGSGADVRIHKSELPPDYTGAVTEEGMDGSSTCTQQCCRTHDNITEEGTSRVAKSDLNSTDAYFATKN